VVLGHTWSLHALAAAASGVYLGLAWVGDLRSKLGVLLLAHAVLTALMLAAWREARVAFERTRGPILGAALVFRLLAALGEPALSDDVYRYVWDGRVQLHGFHPYAFAPDDPALRGLRDADWDRINHPDLKTIYPPLAQILFLLLATAGIGPGGFRLVLGVLDFGVILATGSLLQRLGLPRHRVVLYAWNPLAVLETAGSGHVDPLGVGLLVVAATCVQSGKGLPAALALAGSIQAKLLPAVLLPTFLRRVGLRGSLLCLGAVVAVSLPWALTGPALGPGLYDYAERWEHNAPLFEGVRNGLTRADAAGWLKRSIDTLQQWTGTARVPWEFLYRHVWPDDLARALAALMLVVWVAGVELAGAGGAAWNTLWVLTGVLVLSPTLHPWYVLWVLPFAAAYLSWGWLAFAALVPLSYLGGGGQAVPGWVLGVEYAPLALWLAWSARGSWKADAGRGHPRGTEGSGKVGPRETA
jgi:hypothetical protein